MPPFKDEHVLIVAPGSQTTLAQLGLPESYTPARLRVKTRMFPAPKAGEWEPLKIREKKVKRATAPAASANSAAAAPPEEGAATVPAEGGEEKPEVKVEPNGTGEAKAEGEADEILYEEDPTSDEGAVWPLREGRITDWSCFNALLSHVYETLSPPFHTPILLIAQPSWTQQDHEMITQFVFEKFKTPAFALVDHALATAYAYGTGTATVVDVGYEKCDITAISDFLINEIGRGIAVPDCGGKYMTDRLQNLLAEKGFTEDMSEQLKRSNICEVLAPNAPLPVENAPANPAAVASTGANGSLAAPKTVGAVNGLPRGPGVGTEVGGDENDDKEAEDNEGVLDVASIVTSGKTNEYLAKKEKERVEKAAARKDRKEAGEAARVQRLPNSQRARNVFYYADQKSLHAAAAAAAAEPEPEPVPATVPEAIPAPVPEPSAAPVLAPAPEAAAAPVLAEADTTAPAPAPAPVADINAAADILLAAGAETDSAPVPVPAPEAAPVPIENTAEPAAEQQPRDEQPSDVPMTDVAPPAPISAVDAPPEAAALPAAAPAKKEERRKPRESLGNFRKEVEVGLERFKAADDGLLERIADSIHRCILSVPETAKRSELWESLIVLGNGSKIRGFKDALIATLNNKYLISPSSATIFTSELPSNMTTPAGTGANTPQPQAQPQHHGSGVNPLLLAATTASNPALGPGGMQTPSSFAAAQAAQQHAQIQAQVHSSHGQTPTSIRLVRMAEYFPEWKEAGFDEAHFLGAQVAAKIVFIVDQGQTKGFMSRSEYNDLGPQGIHEFSL